MPAPHKGASIYLSSPSRPMAFPARLPPVDATPAEPVMQRPSAGNHRRFPFEIFSAGSGSRHKFVAALHGRRCGRSQRGGSDGKTASLHKAGSVPAILPLRAGNLRNRGVDHGDTSCGSKVYLASLPRKPTRILPQFVGPDAVTVNSLYFAYGTLDRRPHVSSLLQNSGNISLHPSKRGAQLANLELLSRPQPEDYDRCLKLNTNARLKLKPIRPSYPPDSVHSPGLEQTKTLDVEAFNCTAYFSGKCAEAGEGRKEYVAAKRGEKFVRAPQEEEVNVTFGRGTNAKSGTASKYGEALRHRVGKC